MTGREAAEALGALGLQPQDVETRQSLFDAAIEAFHDIGGPPSLACWVPGRLEVFGKHTDYCGGRSLVGAVPRGFAMLGRPRPDETIRIRDAGRRDEFIINLDRPAGASRSRLKGWRNYAQVVISRLARNFPGVPLAADLVIASDLPSASGMSSSSALMVGLASTLVERARIRTLAAWQENIHGAPDEAGYYACIENGRRFGSLAGDAGVGTHGGSEDHLGIVCSAAGQLSAWRFVPIGPVGAVRVPDDWTFVLASSGVAADKTGSAKDAYNRLSREAAMLLDIWNRHEAPQPSLSAALDSAPGAATRLEALITGSASATHGTDALGRRLSHFVAEHARVAEAISAFQEGDGPRLSALSEASQLDAERLLDNQVPETVALVRAAREHGAFAASAFGAGFGGSVWALVDGRDGIPAAVFAERWLSAHRKAFPHRSAATTFVAQPGPPLTRL
jgi:galactokinase